MSVFTDSNPPPPFHVDVTIGVRTTERWMPTNAQQAEMDAMFKGFAESISSHLAELADQHGLIFVLQDGPTIEGGPT